MMVWELTPRDPGQFFQVEAQKRQNNLFDSEYNWDIHIKMKLVAQNLKL